MRVVIDISDEAYNFCKTCADNKTAVWSEIVIANGRPYEENPKGEWKPKTDFDGFSYCVCSNCNWLNYGDELNFCPNCGADMRGTTNDT